jgi:hypothetical protein
MPRTVLAASAAAFSAALAKLSLEEPAAKIAQPKSADGRMATEAARLEDKELTGRKKKNRLDSHRDLLPKI